MLLIDHFYLPGEAHDQSYDVRLGGGLWLYTGGDLLVATGADHVAGLRTNGS